MGGKMTASKALRPQSRSKITNARLSGRMTTRALLLESDGRSAWARRFRDLVEQIAEEAGGLQHISELKLQLIRRYATLAIEAETLEGKLANGKRVDLDLLARVSGHCRRLAEQIGVDRVTRDTVPDLATIARRHNGG
jgi:hypothetical protein